MPSILDAFPFPFHEPAAQQLHLLLTELHSSPRGAMQIASLAGMDTYSIFPDQAASSLWFEILSQAGKSGQTRQLIQTVHDRLNAQNPKRRFLADLLADRPPPLDTEPRDSEGAPEFLHSTDDVTEPEALLFHDDLMIQIGRVPALVTTLNRLVSLAPAVCRLSVDFNGATGNGTAFRIGPDLLLTNWHVLHLRETGAAATAVTAEFNYEDNGTGGVQSVTTFPCSVETIVTDRKDDWAVIWTTTTIGDAYPIVRLSDAAVPVKREPAYVIQHPSGARKRLGFVRNQVSDFNDRVVQYLTDTQEGSSGSPVFNADGRPIALHHAGGRPQTVVGRPPMKKNEGIRIERVVAGLDQKGIHIS
jgi:hypothetical protein